MRKEKQFILVNTKTEEVLAEGSEAWCKKEKIELSFKINSAYLEIREKSSGCNELWGLVVLSLALIIYEKICGSSKKS